MTEIFIAYQTQILLAASFIYIPFLAFIVSLGMVYLFGRMLMIVTSIRAKNVLAFLSMLGTYGFYFIKFAPEGKLEGKIWLSIIYTAISVILYTLIGFKLYNRVDSLLDKIAEDKTEKPAVTRKKKRTN